MKRTRKGNGMVHLKLSHNGFVERQDFDVIGDLSFLEKKRWTIKIIENFKIKFRFRL